jgi:hypothetical protein
MEAAGFEPAQEFNRCRGNAFCLITDHEADALAAG